MNELDLINHVEEAIRFAISGAVFEKDGSCYTVKEKMDGSSFRKLEALNRALSAISTYKQSNGII